MATTARTAARHVVNVSRTAAARTPSTMPKTMRAGHGACQRSRSSASSPHRCRHPPRSSARWRCPAARVPPTSAATNRPTDGTCCWRRPSRDRRDQQQFDDPGLGQRDVGAEPHAQSTATAPGGNDRALLAGPAGSRRDLHETPLTRRRDRAANVNPNRQERSDAHPRWARSRPPDCPRGERVRAGFANSPSGNPPVRTATSSLNLGTTRLDVLRNRMSSPSRETAGRRHRWRACDLWRLVPS